MPVETIVDENNQYPWTSIEIEFDDNGVMLTRTINFDDGISALETFESGQMTSLLKTDTGDDGGIKPWTSVLMSYDATGRLEERYTIYDDGRALTEMIDGSVEMTLEEDLDDIANWTTIETNSVGRTISDRVITYDNGVIRSELFNGGWLRSVVETDGFEIGDGTPPEHGGVKSWTQRKTSYDSWGLIESRKTEFDNGIYRDEGFEDGQITFKAEFDGYNPWSGSAPPTDGGAFSWDFRAYSYSGGILTGHKIIYDNYIVEQGYYSAYGFPGLLQSTIKTDGFDPTLGEAPPEDGGSMAWTRLITDYHPDGEIFGKTYEFDDGVVRFETYQQGSLWRVYIGDGFMPISENVPADSGVKPWETITESYEVSGLISFRETTYDNGDVKLDRFENGVLFSSLKADGYHPTFDTPPVDGGNAEWSSIETLYSSSGQIESRATIYDDGDTIIFNFEDGERSERVRVDGDGDETWLLSVTTYGEDGNQTVNYDTAEDVPDAYFDYLAFTALSDIA
ncbi:hypothetical protein ACJ5NV_17805 [Loktanella agnita]|uniref:hypothetical protein n=1 Tax=Loktanella agnita TaxID=287097 RepID=UPI00398A1D59